jgi:hypothetical protein
MKTFGRQTRARSREWGVAAALVLALGAAACDSLLEVDLPAAVTSDAVEQAQYATTLVGAVLGQFECGYSSFLMDASGMEDNFQMVTGVAGNYSQYWQSAGGGQCDGDAYSQEWIDPFLIARGEGSSTYNSMVDDWGSPQTLIGMDAFYVAAILDVFGEYFCESAIDGGPMLTPANMLDSAEAWVGNVFAAITANGGDFPISTSAGTQSSSIQASAYGLRARIRWARNGPGDLAAAAADAAMVPDDHVTWVLREAGTKRRNMVSVSQSGGGGIQAAGFLLGPILIKGPTDSYGVTELGEHPNGTAWTSPLRFTGYIDLGIVTATGAALNASGFPVLETDAGAEDDSRVTHAMKSTAGGVLDVPQRYPNEDDDMPLVNWKEMRLIQAEAAGNTQASIDFVNEVRDADGLPGIGTGADTSYRDAILADATGEMWEDMLIEERRRALFEEGRFWATKLRFNDKLWFPRAVGDEINASASYTFGGGVRLLFDNSEYEINPNFVDAGGLEARATGCDPYEAPNGF